MIYSKIAPITWAHECFSFAFWRVAYLSNILNFSASTAATREETWAKTVMYTLKSCERSFPLWFSSTLDENFMSKNAPSPRADYEGGDFLTPDFKIRLKGGDGIPHSHRLGASESSWYHQSARTRISEGQAFEAEHKLWSWAYQLKDVSVFRQHRPCAAAYREARYELMRS